MNEAVLIKECTNILWKRITVDSISSNGIIGINVLGDSCFSNIKSHMLRINYNDTQSAQNNSNHTLLIDHYLITDQSSGRQQLYILKFNFSQHFYKVKIALANAKISCLNNTDIVVYVFLKAKCLQQNEIVLRNSQFIHNNVNVDLLHIKVSEHLAMSNSIVQINACLFSNNIGNKKYPFAIIKIAGVITQVSISDCKFYRNEDIMMITAVKQNLFLTNIYVSNTNFSLNKNAKIVYSSLVKLHLQGPIIFHNNTCSISVLNVRISEVNLTNYIEFSANKVPAIIRYVGKTYAYHYIMLTEYTTLNVSYNIFTDFIELNTVVKLLTLPKCYFQYFSNRQLDNHHGNYLIVFNKNIEMQTQSAYNNLHIVHCSWLPQSAYNTALPPVVNKQYIQFINASGNFANMLPQSNRRKILCYCDDNLHDCYKEVLGPVYPGQTMTVMLKDSRHTQGGNANDVVVDTSSPTAC